MAGNFHEFYHDSTESRGPTNRGFGFTVGGILCAIVAFKFLLRDELPLAWLVALAAGLGLVALAAVQPQWLAVPNRLWMKLGMIMAMIINPIIMLAMFAVLFVPLALFFRMIGRDALRLRRTGDLASYWIDRTPPGPAPDSAKNQY